MWNKVKTCLFIVKFICFTLPLPDFSLTEVDLPTLKRQLKEFQSKAWYWVSAPVFLPKCQWILCWNLKGPSRNVAASWAWKTTLNKVGTRTKLKYKAKIANYSDIDELWVVGCSVTLSHSPFHHSFKALAFLDLKTDLREMVHIMHIPTIEL